MKLVFLTTILELIGSAAFAISGVVVAKKKKMDIFGAVILGCVTAVGGGAIRDLILGIHPQSMFKDRFCFRCFTCPYSVSYLNRKACSCCVDCTTK